jgi:hypothetical protein
MPSRSGAVQFIAAVAAAGVTILVPSTGRAQGSAAPYPSMAPIAQYGMARSAEVSLARSAAPDSIAGAADVLVLAAAGYENAAKGTNGFVCLVQRSWANEFGDAEFWNPKLRAPICFNAAAARSVLPTYLTRTRWALAGVSEPAMKERSRAVAAKGVRAPAIGAMCYMLSKHGYLNDDVAGPWRPHLMFFLPPTSPSAWGANVDRSPVVVNDPRGAAFTTFMVIVAHWSDGTLDSTHGP